jgi:hypothetical protein
MCQDLVEVLNFRRIRTVEIRGPDRSIDQNHCRGRRQESRSPLQ